MTPKQFWTSTPRKLAALSKAHAKMNGAKPDKGPKTVDGVLANKKSTGKGVGAPDAFVDQL